jgi:hypothetical protein
MADLYQGAGDDLDGPASRLRAVTPSDTAPLPIASKALYVGGAGNVAIIAVNDTSPVVLAGVPAGTVLRVRAAQVMATNTTAINIVALV